MRRSLTVVLAAAAAATATLVAAPPAGAACRVTAELPVRIAVERSIHAIPVTLRASCGTVAYASFDLVGPDRLEDVLIWDAAAAGAERTWQLYDSAPAGRYRLSNGAAYDADMADAPVTYGSTVVKRGARAYLTARRTGARVRLAVRATRYDTYLGRFVARAYAPAVLQHRIPRTSAWSVGRRITLDARGRATVVAWGGRSARTFRVTVAEGPTVWGAAATVRR